MPETADTLIYIQNADDLEINVEGFIDTLLAPLTRHVKQAAPRFRTGWSKSAEHLAKQRTKLLQEQTTNPQTYRADKIKLIDKQIKKIVKSNKRIAILREAQKVENLSEEELTIQFFRNQLIRNNDTEHSIDGDNYRMWMESTQNHDSQLQPCNMLITEEFKVLIHTALKKFQLSRLPGRDGLSAELLAINKPTKKHTLAYMPSPLIQSFVVPIYQKGDPDQPINYRPITLLSHIRKIILIAINLLVQQQYQSHTKQFWFTPNCGMELAALHAHKLAQTGYKYMAVLDLKQACPSV